MATFFTKIAPVRRRARFARYLLLGLALAFGGIIPSHAADNRFALASQSDWNNKRGFYINFENSSPGDEICKLSNLKLAMGVGDGTNWRFVITSPAWQYDEDYQVKVQIQPNGSA